MFAIRPQPFYLYLLLSDGESDCDAAVIEGLLQGDDLAVVDAHVGAELCAANKVVRAQVLHTFEIAVGQLKMEPNVNYIRVPLELFRKTR